MQTNCFPIFDIYTEKIDTIPLYFTEENKYAHWQFKR